MVIKMAEFEEMRGRFSMNNAKMDLSVDNSTDFNEAMFTNKLKEVESTRLKEEKRLEELREGKGIKPFGFKILAQKYNKNPYVESMKIGDTTWEDSSEFINQDSGESDNLRQLLTCFKVISVGPDVKHIKAGDDVLCHISNSLPVMFKNERYNLINDGNVACIINNEDVLNERFK